MEAETVRPARNARYTLAAPNKIPKILPRITDLKVNSYIFVSGETNGLKRFNSGITVDLLSKINKKGDADLHHLLNTIESSMLYLFYLLQFD